LTYFSLLPNIFGAATMLLYTSYLDLRKREVEDKIWLIFGAIAAALQGYDLIQGTTTLSEFALALILTIIVGMGIFFLGFYGGADGKALIVLSVFLPYFNPSVGFYPIAPFITLTNGILLSMLLPLSLLVLNITRLIRKQRIFEGFEEPFHRKLVACLLGYKSSGAPRSFQFAMEKRVHKTTGSESEHIGDRKFDFSLLQEEFETLPGTWVTPGIPLLVFFTAGFFILLAYGDLVIGIISFFAKLV
jgi:archaeal preflagellin peptidase FlaK